MFLIKNNFSSLFFQGRICRFVTGCLLAFFSGLTITLNNFVVKATRVNFGEILAIRCIVQIPVMLAYVLVNGLLNMKIHQSINDIE